MRRKVNNTIEFTAKNSDYLLEHFKDSTGYCYIIYRISNGKKIYDHSLGYIDDKATMFKKVDKIIQYYKNETEKGRLGHNF